MIGLANKISNYSFYNRKFNRYYRSTAVRKHNISPAVIKHRKSFFTKRYARLWIDWRNLNDPGDITPFRFTGMERDLETGLYYYGARYLDARTSRWLSGDPAMGEYVPSPGQDPGRLSGLGGVFNIINMHAYHYAGNNPVKYVDPDGREVDIVFTVKSYEETIIRTSDGRIVNGLTAHGELTVTDRDSGDSVTVNAYSGGRGEINGVSLPIPTGEYEILSPTEIGYRLEALDYNRGNDRIDGTNPLQSNIRLHAPGRGLSFGCIGVATNDEWQAVNGLLENTNTGTSSVQRHGGLWLQQSTKYGNLTVTIDSGLQRNSQHQSVTPPRRGAMRPLL